MIQTGWRIRRSKASKSFQNRRLRAPPRQHRAAHAALPPCRLVHQGPARPTACPRAPAERTRSSARSCRTCRSADQTQPAVAVEQRLRQSRPPDVQRRQTGNGRELPCGTCLCTERIRNEAYGHGNGSLVLINPLKHSAVRARRYARLSRPSVETPSLSLHAAATLASRSSRRDSVLTLELLIGNYHPLVGSKRRPIRPPYSQAKYQTINVPRHYAGRPA